jgi:aminopeptidase YwaD
MNTKLLFRIFVLTFLFCLSNLSAQFQRNTVTEERLKSYVQLLASDSLEGRLPGTIGGTTAAKYIAHHFKKFGVKPFQSKEYFQNFPLLTGVEIGKKTSLTINNKQIVLGKDYTPIGFSASANVKKSQVVFVGYGIIGKDVTYNDYNNIDVKGKTVLMLRGVPDPNNPHSEFSKYSSLRYKVLKARELGASAVLFVSTKEQIDSSGEKLMKLSVERTGKEQIPVAHITRSTANEILKGSKKDVDFYEQHFASEKTPYSFLTESTIDVTVELKEIRADVPNVVGMVEGTHPQKKKEIIVVGAHYDHLGKGHNESSMYKDHNHNLVHYGADDNASGTAGVMELAERIAKKPLERTVVFIAFTAEEMGLIGSKEYCALPDVSIENTVAMVNMDMIGRMTKNSLQVQGIGTTSFWNTLMDSLATVYSLELSKTASGQGPSDHSSFNSKQIPVLAVFTGLHSDYHKPSDTWDKINYEGQSAIISFVESTVQYIASLPEKPEYMTVAADTTKKGSTNFRVYVGTIPDYSDHPRGMRISGVSEGSPAQKAGLQEGDVIVKFGTKSITNVYDYTYALAEVSPGQIIEVTYLRDGDEAKKQTCSLTLGSRSNK